MNAPFACPALSRSTGTSLQTREGHRGKKRPGACAPSADRTHATARVTTENSARVTHLHASVLIIGCAPECPHHIGARVAALCGEMARGIGLGLQRAHFEGIRVHIVLATGGFGST